MSHSTRRSFATHVAPSLAVTVVLGVIGLVSVWVQEPFLVPSLASAMFLQALTPNEPSARVWNTAIGQLVGAASGFVALFALTANVTPTFMGDHRLTILRVLAATLAVLLTVVFQLLLKATTAAGGATALVVALGAETATLAGAARLFCGIILVTALGEAARHLILRMKSR